MKTKFIMLLLLIFIIPNQTQGLDSIIIKPSLRANSSGMTPPREVTQNDHRVYDLGHLEVEKGQFVFGSVTIISNKLEDNYANIKYKMFLKISEYSFLYPSIMTIDTGKEYRNGSVIRFARSSSDFLIDKKNDLYFKAYIKSGSSMKVDVELYFDFSAIIVPKFDPKLLDEPQVGNTKPYPASFNVKDSTFLQTFGKSYLFLPTSFTSENLDDKFDNLNFSDYKVDIEIHLRIDREEYSTLDQFELSINRRIFSDFLGGDSYIKCKFKEVYYDDILTFTMKYMGGDAIIEIIDVIMEFPSVHDPSLIEEDFLPIPYKYANLILIAILLSISNGIVIGYWQVKIRAAEKRF